jgi:hypothetical protein
VPVLERLKGLKPELVVAFTRFPVAALISVTLAVYVNLAIARLIGSRDDDYRVYLAGALAFAASGAAHLFAEGRRLSTASGLLIAALCGAAAAALGWFERSFDTNPGSLFAALVLAIMVAAYLRKGAAQGALWWFNSRLAFVTILAFLVALLFAGGLSAILASLDYLFGFTVWRGWYEHIWATAAALVAPLYALSLVPRDLDAEINVADSHYSLPERGISVLVNYVGAPLLLVYTLILHAYAAKIAFTGELPKGQIGALVTAFALGGTGGWLVSWPWRETGTWLLRFFHKYWFAFTIVPAILLAIAVWRRIADYDVTPERYGLVIVGVWLALLALYLAWRRTASDMRPVLGGLGALLLVTSFGPWGSHGLSIARQIARLELMLTDAGALKDGKLTGTKVTPKIAAASQGHSIIGLLGRLDALDRIAPWFAGTTGDPFAAKLDTWTLRGKINETLGFAAPGVTIAQGVWFEANEPVSFDLTAAAFLGGPYRIDQGGAVHEFRFGNEPLDSTNTPAPVAAKSTARIESGALVITLGERTWHHPTLDILEKARAAKNAGTAAKPLVIEAASDLTLIFMQANGDLAEPPTLLRAEFWVVRKK